MPKCDINKVDLQHIFRTPFPKNTSGRLLQISEILLTGKKNLGPKRDLNVWLEGRDVVTVNGKATLKGVSKILSNIYEGTFLWKSFWNQTMFRNGIVF